MVTDVVFKIVAFAVLTPTVAILFQAFLVLSGRDVLADDDILTFFMGPLGWSCLVVVGAVSIGVMALEMAALMVIAHGEKHGHHVTVVQALIFSTKRAFGVLRLTARITTWALLLSTPFLVAAAAVYATLLTTYDINYYLSNKPPAFWGAVVLGFAIGLGLAVVAVQFATVWLFSLPLVLFESKSPRAALHASGKRTKGHRRAIAGWVVACALAGSLVSGLANGIVTWIAQTVVSLGSNSLSTLAFILGAVLTLWGVVNFILLLLSNALFATLLLNLYWRIARDADSDLTALGSPSREKKSAFQLTKKRLLAGAVLATIFAAGVASYMLYSVHLEKDHTTIMAHRGASRAAPENTLAAVRRAIDDGTDWVEIDVQETADGEVIVMHDSDFKKIAGNNLKIWDATMADLENLDIGSWFAAEFKDERVPTLSQVLEVCKGKVGVNIELKYYGHDQDLEQRVIDIVERHGMQNEIVIMSLKLAAVSKTKQLRPAWKVGLLTAIAFGDLTAVQADFLAVESSLATSRFIAAAHRTGKEVYVWTVNDPLEMSTLMGRDVDSLITDEPAIARSVFNQRAQMSLLERSIVKAATLLKATPQHVTLDDF